MGIFARVLRDVLTAHADEDFSYLGGQSPRTDPLWYPLRRLAIAPEVISRLKEAAGSNEKRATLNPEDLEYAAEKLHFTIEERARLRAALLAQGVEIFLRDRLSDNDFTAATEIAETVFERLLEQFDSTFDRVRYFNTVAGEVDERDERTEFALALADRAASLVQAALVARQHGAAIEERLWARLAATTYQEAADIAGPAEPSLATELAERARRLLP